MRTTRLAVVAILLALRLITCGGVVDPRSRHYRDDVVVTAVPAP